MLPPRNYHPSLLPKDLRMGILGFCRRLGNLSAAIFSGTLTWDLHRIDHPGYRAEDRSLCSHIMHVHTRIWRPEYGEKKNLTERGL